MITVKMAEYIARRVAMTTRGSPNTRIEIRVILGTIEPKFESEIYSLDTDEEPSTSVTIIERMPY